MKHTTLIPMIGPSKPAVEANSVITVEASIERIWQLLVDVEGWPRWNPAVSRVRLDGLLVEGASFVWKSQGFTVTSTVRTMQPKCRLTWSGRAPGTQALHHWILAPSPEGTVVSTSESFDGWLPRLLPGPMQRSLQQTLDAWLVALKTAAERR